MKYAFDKKGNITGILMSVFLILAIFEGVLLFLFIPKNFLSDPMNNIVAAINPTIENSEVLEIYDAINDTAWNSVHSNIFISIEITYRKTLLSSPEAVGYTGSGVIYKEDTNKYFALTNDHVVTVMDDYDHYYDVHVVSKVSDYLGNEVLFNVVSTSPTYDLAVISFSNSINDLPLVSLANLNPILGEKVIAIGQPNGQLNTVTLGTVTGYVLVQDGVSFPCIISNAKIDSGSSGGMLINYDGLLIGINTYSDEESLYTASIPIEKVIEFLTNESLI